MDNSRLPYQAYKMLCTLDDNGKKNWVTNVRQTLFCLGYGFVWLNPDVATEQHFIAQLKQRFIDVYLQERVANPRGSTSFDMYILFKTSIKYETYLDFVKVNCFRDALMKHSKHIRTTSGKFILICVCVCVWGRGGCLSSH